MKNLILGLFLFSGFSLAQDDNQISLEQSGDNLALGIDQIGYNNRIQMKDSNSYITAPNLSMYLVQYNQTSGINKIIFDEVSGSNNKIKLGQGVAWDDPSSETNLDWNYDGYEGGGHEMNIILYGDYNHMAGSQTNQGSTDGHEFNLHLAGDDNEVIFKQQSDGEKTLDLTIYNDENEVFVRQHGNGATHTASITLDGLYGTDIDLKQLGTTTQGYSITQYCVTVGGCAVTVTQE
jgi:hypothetical protein